MCECMSVCGHTCLDICRLNGLNALLQQQQTDRRSGVAKGGVYTIQQTFSKPYNAPRLNCGFLLAIARRILVTSLMLQLS